MVRRLSCVVALCGLLAHGWAAEPEKPAGVSDRVELIAINYDTLYYVAGGTLEGSVIEKLSNGAIRFARIGRPPTVIPQELIKDIIPHRSLADAIRQRGAQALAARDWIDVQRVLRFVQEQLAKPPVKSVAKPGESPPSTPQEVQAAGLELAQKTMAQKPPLDLLTQMAVMSEAAGDGATAIAAAQAGLQMDPNWTLGYEIQARQLLAAKDEAGMKALVTIWLTRQPTAYQANRFQATTAEAGGNLPLASDSYRKCWELHHDGEAAIGFLRCSLLLGRYDEATRVAKSVLEDRTLPAPQIAAAHFALGTALLGQTTPALALAVDHLSKAMASPDLDPAMADQGGYNLGLARWRLGQWDEAKKLWAKVKSPLGAAALAWAERRAIEPATVAVGGTVPPTIDAWISEHNAAIDLEQQRPTAIPNFPGRSTRHDEMERYAQVLRSAGSPDSLRAVTAQKGIEALRWRIYGMLLAGHSSADLDPLLAQLGEGDGWGLAVRVHLAAVRKDQIQARAWWAKLQAAPDAPKDYVARLSREFAAENNDEIVESFDWPDEDAPGLGYQVTAPGTGIAIHARQGKLHLKGTQSAGAESTSVVWRTVPSDRLVFAQVQIERTAGAIAGLELSDADRQNIIQVGVKPEGGIVWRTIADGVTSAWTPLGPGRTPKIEIDHGKCIVAAADNSNRQPVVATLARAQTMRVGVFCVAEPGSVVSALADNLVIDLAKNASRTQGKTGP